MTFHGPYPGWTIQKAGGLRLHDGDSSFEVPIVGSVPWDGVEILRSDASVEKPNSGIKPEFLRGRSEQGNERSDHEFGTLEERVSGVITRRRACGLTAYLSNTERGSLNRMTSREIPKGHDVVFHRDLHQIEKWHWLVRYCIHTPIAKLRLISCFIM